jgi:uncharacterized protein (TIGR00299 family) protein
MKVFYFDCFAGVSGDMIVGALLDLGLDFDLLKDGLASLRLGGFEIRSERVVRCGIAATKFQVDVQPRHQPHRTLKDIRAIISAADLSQRVKDRSLAAFNLIAEAEARVHDRSIEDVHFHEVGAVDSLVDTVGAMIGFEVLDVDSLIASPLRLGRGEVKTEHGVLPVPAPATALIVQGLPVYAGDEEGEFVTPTGAAILRSLCERFESMPQMTIDKVGYGAGSRNPAGFPNVLRVLAGQQNETAFERDPEPEGDEAVVVVETNIDDMNPQVCGYVMERALELGARDVFFTAVQMKKDRPGILLTIVCDEELLDRMTCLVLSETTTLGVRYHRANRRVLERSFELVNTRYGEVRVKVARARGRTLHFQAEYQDCARLATIHNVPLIEVQSAANAAYRKASGSEGLSKDDVQLKDKSNIGGSPED